MPRRNPSKVRASNGMNRPHRNKGKRKPPPLTPLQSHPSKRPARR